MIFNILDILNDILIFNVNENQRIKKEIKDHDSLCDNVF